jgi:hypothetical protein
MHRKIFLARLTRKFMRFFNSFAAPKEAEELISNLVDKYGYQRTILEQKPVDVDGEPIPWFTYPAIEYLCQLDLHEKNIFEWGSGNSSLFFAKRCKEIISIEADRNWYEYGIKNLRSNQHLIFKEETAFVDIIDKFSKKFDLIIIDSLYRYECTMKAIEYLAQGGIIVLDNSDWHPKTSALLREKGNFIEVDMHGFGPINGYSWTTSLYFHRDFKMTTLDAKQPAYSKAAIQQISEYDQAMLREDE